MTPEPTNSIFLWPAIVLIGIIAAIVCARFLFRLALFVAAILLIWWCLGYVGLVPSPVNFFAEKYPALSEKKQQNVPPKTPKGRLLPGNGYINAMCDFSCRKSAHGGK